jgi:phospholipid/cholesterol/gamma-HCH transport system ATP-binding protein
VIDELMIEVSERTGATSIIVTHEMESAFRVATRMAMVYKGNVIQSGTPAEMRASTDPVVAQFLSGDTEGPILEDAAKAAAQAAATAIASRISAKRTFPNRKKR